MASDKRIGLSSAYGQLIVLVFLPILVLAMVGGALVFYEGSRASRSEQQAQAEVVLIRHKPRLSQALNDAFGQDAFVNAESMDPDQAANSTPTTVEEQNPNSSESVTDATDKIEADPRWFSLRTKLSRVQSDRHVQRAAFIDERGQVMLSVGYATDKPWPWFDNQVEVVEAASTAIGTAYGTYVGQVDGRKIWLLGDMDNEPLLIARYRIALALAITGLLTLLILLLSLNIYAKRWITPIY